MKNSEQHNYLPNKKYSDSQARLHAKWSYGMSPVRHCGKCVKILHMIGILLILLILDISKMLSNSDWLRRRPVATEATNTMASTSTNLHSVHSTLQWYIQIYSKCKALKQLFRILIVTPASILKAHSASDSIIFLAHHKYLIPQQSYRLRATYYKWYCIPQYQNRQKKQKKNRQINKCFRKSPSVGFACIHRELVPSALSYSWSNYSFGFLSIKGQPFFRHTWIWNSLD